MSDDNQKPTDPGVYWARPAFVKPPQKWRPMKVAIDPDDGTLVALGGSANPWDLDEWIWGDPVKYANDPNETESCSTNVHVWPGSVHVYGPGQFSGDERCRCGALRACEFREPPR